MNKLPVAAAAAIPMEIQVLPRLPEQKKKTVLVCSTNVADTAAKTEV